MPRHIVTFHDTLSYVTILYIITCHNILYMSPHNVIFHNTLPPVTTHATTQCHLPQYIVTCHDPLPHATTQRHVPQYSHGTLSPVAKHCRPARAARSSTPCGSAIGRALLTNGPSGWGAIAMPIPRLMPPPGLFSAACGRGCELLYHTRTRGYCSTR